MKYFLGMLQADHYSYAEGSAVCPFWYDKAFYFIISHTFYSGTLISVLLLG